MNTIVLSPAATYAFARVSGWSCLAILCLLAAVAGLPVLIFPALIFSAWGFFRYLSWRVIRYELSEELLKVTTGIFLKRTDSLELYRVKDQVVTRNLLMQWFGLMNLELLTTDLTSPVTRLSGIPASDIADLIRERVQRARQQSKIVELN